MYKDISQTFRTINTSGDATPCTAWYSLYWPCFQGNQLSLQEPEYTNADVVHRMVPTAKIIVMIRDPIDRLVIFVLVGNFLIVKIKTNIEITFSIISYSLIAFFFFFVVVSALHFPIILPALFFPLFFFFTSFLHCLFFLCFSFFPSIYVLLVWYFTISDALY